MRPATAYSKCYILYLFVAVILLSLTSLHMCVVVAAEESLEENVVAELKQKAGEVEALAGGVKKSNEEMVTSAREVVKLLTETTIKINEAKGNKEMAEKENDKWAAIVEATNSAKKSAEEAVKVAENIQTAANKAGVAMQKMAARANVISSDAENMNSLISEFKNETDTTVSLWGEVSSDDVQLLLDIVSAIVEETNRAKVELDRKTQENLALEGEDVEKNDEKTSDKKKTDLSEELNVAAQKEDIEKKRGEGTHQVSQSKNELETKNPKQQQEVVPAKAASQITPQESVTAPETPKSVLQHGEGQGKDLNIEPKEPILPDLTAKLQINKERETEPHTLSKIKPVTAKVMRLMQTETAIENETEENSQRENKKNKVVETLEKTVEESKRLTEAAQLVKDKIDNVRQLSEKIAQLADAVIKMKESKELSALPFSFGSLVFVVNNICLTTFVTLTYVLRNTL